MSNLKWRKRLEQLLVLVATAACFYILWWKKQLGLARFFDMDEFAYLHWAHNLFLGQKPYLDFFLLVPPGYLLFLSPLFLLGKGLVPVLAARLVAFGVFVILTAVTASLFWYQRRAIVGAAWVALVLAFLPMPADKFLEIRPDTLATLFLMLGLFVQFVWLRRPRYPFALVSGFFYGLSLFVLPKIAPNIALAALVTLLVGRKNFLVFSAGLALPWLFFGLWALSAGGLATVWYSLVKLPIESGKLGNLFPLPVSFFFSPNSTYYGLPGVHAGFLTNHSLWLIGFLTALLRLLTLSSLKKPEQFWGEILLLGFLSLQVFLYLFVYPLKHAQYLIPIAVFVAWYVGDYVGLLWAAARSAKALTGGTALLIAVAASLIYSSTSVNAAKLLQSNAPQLSEMQAMWQVIPEKTYVFDLTGESLYFRDPYYVCCLPFGQFAQFLSQPLPALIPALSATRTQYIFLGERLWTLILADRAYIQGHFSSQNGLPVFVRNPESL